MRDLIEKLTERQRGALGLIAIGEDGMHHSRTLETLLRKGLIEQYEQALPGGLPVRIKRYRVPLAVYAAWCEWCAENVSEEEFTP